MLASPSASASFDLLLFFSFFSFLLFLLATDASPSAAAGRAEVDASTSTDMDVTSPASEAAALAFFSFLSDLPILNDRMCPQQFVYNLNQTKAVSNPDE
jgi:hypothetical protein